MNYAVVPVTPLQQNCSLVWCEETRQAAIIDPGGDVERIVAAVEKLNLQPAKILITHAHADHAGGAAKLAARLGIPIEGPQREDQFWIDLMVEQGRTFGLSPSDAFTPDRWLEQGDRVQFGNQQMEVLHCPGHTPGHVVFFHRASRTAFVGDVLFRGSIGRTDFPRGDYDALMGAIRDRLLPLGDDVTIVTGHGPNSTLGRERRSNPFLEGMD